MFYLFFFDFKVMFVLFLPAFIPLLDVGYFFFLSRYTIHLVHVILAVGVVVGHCMTANGRPREAAGGG